MRDRGPERRRRHRALGRRNWHPNANTTVNADTDAENVQHANWRSSRADRKIEERQFSGLGGGSSYD